MSGIGEKMTRPHRLLRVAMPVTHLGLRSSLAPRRLSPLLLLAAALLAAAVSLVGAPPAQAQQATKLVVFGYDLSPDFSYSTSVSESIGTLRVPITVSELPTSSLTVEVTAMDITAQEGTDYTFGSAKSVTFTSTGAKTQFVEFTITDDAGYEAEEYLKLNPSIPNAASGYTFVVGAVSNNAAAFITIVDDDLSATPSGKQYAITPLVTAAEGATAELTVTLGETAPSGGLSFTVTPRYCTCAPSDLARNAVAADVRTVPSTVTVAAGSNTATLSIPIATDGETEADEHFTVDISASATGWSAVTGGDSGAVIITNTEVPPGTHWADTLTVKHLELAPGVNGRGCGYTYAHRGSRCRDAGVLANGNTITYHGASYKIEMVLVAYAGGTLQFILTAEPKDRDGSTTEASRLALIVDGREFAFADATVTEQRTPDNRASWWSLHWTGTGMAWNVNDTVSLSLVTRVGGL